MAAAPFTETTPIYNYEVIRRFTLMTLFWGVLGMGMGALPFCCRALIRGYKQIISYSFSVSCACD
jgi:cbb3-type cytochrome oxidase subunit 1